MAQERHPADTATIMSSFEEIDPVHTVLDKLRSLGISDGDITVLSSLPFSGDILGRPHVKTRLPIISLVGAVVGLGAGIFFTVITPYLYIIRVGGQPIVPVPPTALLLYEFIMLLLIVSTFGGFLVLNGFPSRGAKYYDPQLNDGRISLVIEAPAEKREDVVAVLGEYGAQVAEEPERREL
jgi:hypothetical protein